MQLFSDHVDRIRGYQGGGATRSQVRYETVQGTNSPSHCQTERYSSGSSDEELWNDFQSNLGLVHGCLYCKLEEHDCHGIVEKAFRFQQRG